MTDQSAQQKRSSGAVIDLPTVLAILAVIFFPIVPLILGANSSPNYYFGVLVFIPSVGASILCIFVGLGLGIARKSKAGIGLNLLVVLGWVLYVAWSSSQPAEYMEGYRLSKEDATRHHMSWGTNLLNSALKGVDPEPQLRLEAYAEQGNPILQYCLGSLYDKKQDYARAYYWIYLAVSATEAEAYHRSYVETLGRIAAKMSPAQIAVAEGLARKWKLVEFRGSSFLGELFFGGPTYGRLDHLAGALREDGRYEEATALYERTLEIREEYLGLDHVDVAETLDYLASIYVLQGQYDKALPLYDRSLAIQETKFTQNPEVGHFRLGLTLSKLGTILGSENTLQGQSSEAEDLFKRALVLVDTYGWADHQRHALRVRSLQTLAEFYRKNGREKDAIDAEEQARAVTTHRQTDDSTLDRRSQ